MNTYAKPNGHRSCVVPLILVLQLVTVPLRAAEPELAGLWQAQRIFGPVVSGPLHVRRIGDHLYADVAGQRALVTLNEGRMRFSLADGSVFDGHSDATGNISGHWMQVRSKLDGNVFSTPVDLVKSKEGW